MSHTNTILPVDHWTVGLGPTELRGLAERHRVVYEVVPSQGVVDGALVRRGWAIDLYGRRSKADAKLGMVQASEHLHDVLHAIAVTVAPMHADAVSVQLSPNTGAVHVDPRDFVEEVRLRIDVQPRSDARPTLIADGGSTEMDAITRALERLGVHRR